VCGCKENKGKEKMMGVHCMTKDEQKRKKKVKKFEVTRREFYVLAKDEDDLKRKLKANPDFSECGQFVSCEFIKFEEMK
jgi:hypothetical protein